ncbi:MAG: MFS transporter [Methanotrichaceae archaeon]
MRDATANKNAALIISALSSFLTPFMGSSVNIALPAIGQEFAIDAVTLSWVTTSAILAAAMFLVPFGRLADIRGRKKIYTCGVVIYTASALFCSVSTSAFMLITVRFAQGFGAAMIFGTGIAILASVFPARERGKALGINVAAVYLGLTLGPSLGGFLTQQFGWRSVFLSNVPVGLIVIWLILWKLKGEWAEAKGEQFDLTGSAIYSLALVATICGFSLLPEMVGRWLVIIGVFGILVFARWEMKVECPILDMKLFKENRTFAFSNLAALINYSATFALVFLLSLYLQYIKELSPQNAGLILISQPVIMTLVSPIAGRLSDRIEPQTLASTGLALTTLALITFVFLDKETSLKIIVICLMILGMGTGIFSSPNTNAVMGSVETKSYGVASATLGTMRMTGQMLSMGIVMLAFSLYMGKVQITPENYPLFLRSIKAAFIVFSMLSFAGIFASKARGNRQLNRSLRNS